MGRNEQLGLLLIWEGSLGRSRLMSLFNLSPVRASEWIRELRTHHADWMRWDSRTRRYHATETAYAEWREQGNDSSDNSFARYLALVALPVASTTAGNSPVWTAFGDFSTPSPKVFSCLREAIERKLSIEIQYRSMREPRPHRRIIEAHSLVRAGRRWHARAYCTLNGDFRDYSLGRISSTKLLDQPAEHDVAHDEAWQTVARVSIVAHPALTEEQRGVVRFEYFQGAASRVQHCRAALVPYLIQDLRAATDVAVQLPPDYQLAVGNLKEIRRWFFPE